MPTGSIAGRNVLRVVDAFGANAKNDGATSEFAVALQTIGRDRDGNAAVCFDDETAVVLD